MKKVSQKQLVLNHLIDHGYITQVIAGSYGIRRLASRIDELKSLYYPINVEYLRDDLGVRYARYSMSDSMRALYQAERNDWPEEFGRAA